MTSDDRESLVGPTAGRFSFLPPKESQSQDDEDDYDDNDRDDCALGNFLLATLLAILLSPATAAILAVAITPTPRGAYESETAYRAPDEGVGLRMGEGFVERGRRERGG